MDENGILIGSSENNIFLKAYGHITANLCFPLREDLYKKISTIKNAPNIYFDLSEIKYMDSTFIGLLVGIDKKLFSTFKNRLLISNPSNIAVELLTKMNLMSFFKTQNMELPKVDYKVFDATINISEIEKTKIILIAHKDLGEISPENEKRFKSLTGILEEQIRERN